ncbi:UNVERIFIED_CONTAM: Retrovirus-related Pol polyprotein from transposon RE1 [Sesamum latifolium]|uniref:Retrovirus-related Pol polyprotein from transposon RE1 n=1 Tax=Sesamum latifolium TaxID=2727402 RepID=A0AAW2WB09_9LAMI
MDKRSMLCDYCKKPDHLKDNCFKLHRTPEWYKDLTEKKRKGASRGRGLVAPVEVVSPAAIPQFRGSDFSTILRTEIRKVLAENTPPQLQQNTAFDDVRINFSHLEDMEKLAGTSLTQAKYVQDTLHETGLQDAKAVTMPLPQGVKLCGGALLADPEPYQHLVGRLLYLVFTRPNISYGVQQLSQYLQKPCESHWQAALHVVRYLKGTSAAGLFFPSPNSLQLQAYCDAY